MVCPPSRAEILCLPNALQYYFELSQHLWSEDCGVIRVVHQGEGGEQGDASIPTVYALGQHGALESIQYWLHPDEHSFAHLDDVYVVCTLERVRGSVHKNYRRGFWRHTPESSSILGKTRVWNRGGHNRLVSALMTSLTDNVQT